jgi:glycine betaine catabolism B
MIRWLDRVTGKVTMYRLVLICLLAVALESLLVALTGQLAPYTALGILVSLVVAVAVSYLSNRLFALVFRVQPHSESSLITGLILGMLFLPILDAAHLATIAVAALLASASKYLLAIRRRHVFNPAAAGAFVAGLIFPLDGAGWWVATIWLLPIVTLAALVILFRTRHLALGVVFTVIAAGTVTAITVATGSAAFGSALATALVSFPIVFFVGFMLSEPLTLPPRRWQQLVEAVIVGGLFGLETLGFHLGPIYASPLVALLVGNLLAFLVGQRRGIRLDYLGRKKLTSTSWELSFRPLRPVRFSAGQYVELSLPHRGTDVRGLRRIFSIASAPIETDVLRLGLTIAQRSSSFKAALLALEPGEIVSATAIGGDFLLPRESSRPLLYVAGGIGITPFISHLEQLAGTADARDVVVIYSASSAGELAYSDRLAELGHPVLVIGARAPQLLPENWTYLGAGPVTPELLASAVPDARHRAAYVSGAPAFVHDARRALRQAGVRRVRADFFSGYSTKASTKVALPSQTRAS